MGVQQIKQVLQVKRTLQTKQRQIMNQVLLRILAMLVHQTRPQLMDITNPTVSMTEAVKVFKEAHPDAKIESVDLDNDSGRLHYDIDGFDSSKEYETEIDATTKEIKENEVDTERENDESIDFSAIIDPAKAIEIASTRAEVDGLTPTGWSLEADDGKQKYTIEYDEMNDSDIEIKINAITEEILEVEK